MSLVEIARFTDVYEADLAAAFLRSADIEVTVTERFQTTVDPLMQRALGIRLMVAAPLAAEARDLLARAQAGEFATDEGDDLPHLASGARTATGLASVLAWTIGGYWGGALPRRLRAPSWQGVLLAMAGAALMMFAAIVVLQLLFNPP